MSAAREAVVTEALTWLRTPFHSGAQLKGVGVDCVHLLIAVYSAVGAVEPFAVAPYPPDWWMHRDEERILAGLERCGARAVDAPQPGDLATYQFGRCFSHLAIVIAWPRIIHAHYRVGAVELADGDVMDLAVNPNHPRCAKARRFYAVLP